MKNLPYIVFALVILAVMEGIVWIVLGSSSESDPKKISVVDEEKTAKQFQEQTEPASPSVSSVENEPNATMVSGNFPVPSTEVVDGVTERTIHIGVRQYVWEPSAIVAKKGELVRLIIHNADVTHGLVIPDLGVNQDIPPDGAVVIFTASKKGTFEFFCSVWCGEGHMEMQGTLVIE